MLNLHIKTIPDEKQRYNTVGDYYEKGHTQEITVSEMGDWKYEALTALHEIIESILCKARSITDDKIDAFDFKYEQERKQGDLSEPGDDPRAPYNKEHIFASKIEKMIAVELGVDWEKYGEVVNRLNQQ